ncbi:MarR family winged helix-turn-helix transcriptional regulator [Micromonospora sp. WMMD812]|uniref:MarR family winged helix-turn-helix transcriptional regulator n=1 Tax=Micromonospora sp. WMMD812 TaxID=3015152 RepID=UPI00248CE894|nr:MarR family winged helix-turn-helix transcriptional regulator [Micromonospora sp. WMMD812]WBB69189.1 MarR family winged helix-turn-helix transcriptional regulator [Micromonospora sp. WMMD812]
MENLSLTPATQAVLDALTELGHGTVHELADKSGKARSTTDKAIRTLADAGLIAPTERDRDAAEDTPSRWALATPAEPTNTLPADSAGVAKTAQVAAPGPGSAADEPDAGDTATDEQPGQAVDAGSHATAVNATDHDDDTDDAEHDSDVDDVDSSNDARTVAAVQSARPGDRKVMAIKGVLADHGDDGATLDTIVAESGIAHPTATRLLTAMEQADAARRQPGQRWIAGPTKASDVDPNPRPPRCPLCYQAIRGSTSAPSAAAAVRPLIQPDGTLHILGPDGATHAVTLPTRTPPPAPGITGRAGRSDGTVNGDGSQPFARGELERLTLEVLATDPGRAMTPQDIATDIGGRLGRSVSSGAVRNNCTKAAAAGRIRLVSDAPLTFTSPAQPDNGTAAEAATGSTTGQP